MPVQVPEARGGIPVGMPRRGGIVIDRERRKLRGSPFPAPVGPNAVALTGVSVRTAAAPEMTVFGADGARPAWP